MMPQKALILATSLLVSSNSWAVIDSNPQLSMTGDNIKLTIPGNNRGGNVRFYIDMDNNPATGSTDQESGIAGADYYIENDIIYAAAGDTWKYISGDLITFSNEKENLELDINTTTFDTLANSTELLNNEGKIDGFNGTIKMNVVTLDDRWNVVDSSGPTEYNIFDIEIPVAAETPISEPSPTTEIVYTETPTAIPEQPAEPAVTETPSSETETNAETEPSTDVANSNATEEVAETKKERRKRLRKERRKAKRLERQARKKRQRERRQKRREERMAAN